MQTTKRRPTSSTKSILLVIGAAVFSFLIMLFFLYRIDPGESVPALQDEVAAPEIEVAPFDPEKAVSLFQMLGDGSLQVVVVRDGSDLRQIALIQEHLREKARRYGSGDFSDAAKVHAEDMSWVHELKAGAGQIDVQYEELPNGGQIRFRTANPRLVRTLHQWLGAQVSDWENQASLR